MKYVKMTFQIVSEDGAVFVERVYKIPVESCKHAPSRMLPGLAEREAGKFWEEAINKCALEEGKH